MAASSPHIASGVRLGVVTGMQSEAAIARRFATDIETAPGERARAAAERLVAAGAEALLSFGIAGGLDPALTPGTIVSASELVTAAGRYAIDPSLNFAARSGPLYGAVHAVATIAEKRALFETTGALAVDMESAAVAEVAARHGLKFGVLRAIADPADRALPPAALVGLDEQGRPAIFRVLGSLLRAPGQLPALLSIAGDSNRALRALTLVAPTIAVRLRRSVA